MGAPAPIACTHANGYYTTTLQNLVMHDTALHRLCQLAYFQPITIVAERLSFQIHLIDLDANEACNYRSLEIFVHKNFHVLKFRV